MRRLHLTKVFMGLTLLGIILLLLSADGCGSRYERISSLAFSPDSKRLAVAKHDAQDSNTPWKFYLSNVCRTVSVLDVPNLRTERTIEQDLRPGNQGPAFHLFGHARDTLGFLSDSRTLVVVHFGGGDLVRYDIDTGTKESLRLEEPLPITLRTAGADGVLATGNWNEVSLLDGRTGKKGRGFEAHVEPFSGAPLFMVARDGLLIATVGDDSVKLWNIIDGTLISTVGGMTDQYRISGIDLSPTLKQLAVGSTSSLRLYDFNGKQIRQIDSLDGISTIRYSSNGKRLAAATRNWVTLFDAETGEVVGDLPAKSRITCLEYSPDGAYLAAGDTAGKVLLWKTDTGEQAAFVKPPGRYRPPWTLPAALLAVWLFVCFRQLSITARTDAG